MSAAAYGIGLALGSSIFGLLALVPLAVLLGFLLMQFCFLTLVQAATVSGVYFAVQIGIVLVFFGMK